MPPLAINHHAIGIAQPGFIRDALFDGNKNSFFFFLPIAVEFVETGRNLVRLCGIFCAEKFDHICRHIHASGRIDAWSYAECHLAGTQAFATKLGNFE